ncbi:MAG: AI-2E family transporter [Lachnospiraceae bacterium]
MKFQWKKYFCILSGLFLLYLAIYYWPSFSGFLRVLISATSPLVIGCAVAYFLNILMAFYERHYFPKSQRKWVQTSRRPVCLIGALLTLLAIIVFVCTLVTTQLADCFKLLFSQLPSSLEKAIAFLTEHQLISENISEDLEAINWTEKIEQFASVLLSGFGNLLDVVISAVSTLFSAVTTTVLALIFSIYVLADKEHLAIQSRHFLQHYMKEKWYKKFVYVLSVLDNSFHRFFVGQCTEAVILGVLCTIGMLLLRLPYASMIGVLIGFTALVPIVGAFIGGAVGAFLILMESPIQALIFLVFLLILQQLEGNLIYPRVVGTSIGLPSIWVLAVVTIAGSVFGILGILLGIPLAAAIYKMIYTDMHKKK